MRTSAFVSRVLQAYPSVPRTDVITKVNEALDIIFEKPLSIMRVLDSETGTDPKFSTTSGVFTYTLSNVDTGVGSDEIAFIGRISSEPFDDENDTEEVAAFEWHNVDASGSVVITFREDPKGRDYYIECYKKHTKIITETNPSVLPFPDKYAITYLYDLVSSMYEQIFHGKSINLENFHVNKLPLLHGKLSETRATFVYHVNERYY